MQKWILAGFCLVLVILLINGLLAYRNLQTLMENQRSVAHTFEVQGEIEGLLNNLRDMGASPGAYLLNGDDTFLAAYELAKERVPKRIESLRKLTADNRSQQERLDKI